MFRDLKFCSFRVTRRKKQSASIPAEDSGKQVLCVSFRGYLRPCDFANPAFGLLCISTEDCRCGQARLHVHTYRCSRRENDWRLKKKSWKKNGVSESRRTHGERSISFCTIFFLSLGWAYSDGTK